MRTAELRRTDHMIRIVFKVLIMLMIAGLTGLLIYAIIAGSDVTTRLTGAGVSVTGISGLLYFFMKYDIASVGMQNPDNISEATMNEIVRTTPKK